MDTENLILEPVAACEQCGSSSYTKLHRIDERWIVRCSLCGTYYHNPRTTENYDLLYFTNKTLPDTLVLPHFDKNRIIVFKSEFSYLASLKNPQTDILLDIGCGDGCFPYLMKQHGWKNIFCTEISRAAAAHAYQHMKEHVYTKVLKECAFPDNLFAIITLWDVLDLMHRPRTELIEINRILKKDGIIMLRMRNMDFHIPLFKISAFIARYLNIELSIVHKYGFTKNSLADLLARCGFKVIKIKNSMVSGSNFYIKILFFLFCELLSLLTGGHLLIAPSMIIYAQKK